MDMEIYTKIQGEDGGSEIIQLKRLAGAGGYEASDGSYNGTEPLDCNVWPGEGRAILATLPVEWYDAPGAAVTVSFPKYAIDALEIGDHLARIMITAEVVRTGSFRLRIISGPGEAAARVVYHTFAQLKGVRPDVDRYFFPSIDEAGFRNVAARARTWIDGEILDAGGRGNPYWHQYRTGYADALAADGLDLTTPGGLKIAEASVYYTLALILDRADGMTNDPEGLLEKSKEYEGRARAKLDGACADFLTSYGLRSIKLGGLHVGRLTR